MITTNRLKLTLILGVVCALVSGMLGSTAVMSLQWPTVKAKVIDRVNKRKVKRIKTSDAVVRYSMGGHAYETVINNYSSWRTDEVEVKCNPANPNQAIEYLSWYRSTEGQLCVDLGVLALVLFFSALSGAYTSSSISPVRSAAARTPNACRP